MSRIKKHHYKCPVIRFYNNYHARTYQFIYCITEIDRSEKFIKAVCDECGGYTTSLLKVLQLQNNFYSRVLNNGKNKPGDLLNVYLGLWRDYLLLNKELYASVNEIPEEEIDNYISNQISIDTEFFLNEGEEKMMIDGYFYNHYELIGFCDQDKIDTFVNSQIIKYNSDIYGQNKVSEDRKHMKGTYCVYLHTSPYGKHYVGITVNQDNPNKRWQNGEGYYLQTKFYNAIKKYGWDNFQHKILLKNLDEQTALIKESEYILKYNSIQNGYNIEL